MTGELVYFWLISVQAPLCWVEYRTLCFVFFFLFPAWRNSFSSIEPSLAVYRKRNINSHLCFCDIQVEATD